MSVFMRKNRNNSYIYRRSGLTSPVFYKCTFSQKKLLPNHVICAIIPPDTGYASLNRKQVRILREPVTVNADVIFTDAVSRTAASGNAIGKPRRHDGGLPHEPGYLPVVRKEAASAGIITIPFRRCPTILFFQGDRNDEKTPFLSEILRTGDPCGHHGIHSPRMRQQGR